MVRKEYISSKQIKNFNKREYHCGWWQKRWDIFLIWRSGWDFTLLTVDSWATRITPAMHLVNTYLTDELLMKRRGRTSPSEETCAWGGDEFDSQRSALIEDEYSAINVGRWGGTPYGELRVCALHASSAEEFGLDLMTLTFKWGWERPKGSQSGLKNRK